MLHQRLQNVLKWYHNMVDPKTKLLAYEFDPIIGMYRYENSPIRNIGAIWNMETLSNHMNDCSLQDTIDRSLEFYAKSLVQFEEEAVKMMRFDAKKLQEHPIIAHNAMMILSLTENKNISQHLKTIEQLSDAIVYQQRLNGSFEIHFGGNLPDYGKEFYPGEAMLSLVRAYNVVPHLRYYHSVVSAMPYYRDLMDEVSDDLIVFYANWQTQAMSALYHLTEDVKLKGSIRNFVFELQDRVEASHFYESIQRHPRRCATVHVACGCEALADACSLVTEKDFELKERFSKNLQIVVLFLLEVQLKEGRDIDSRGVGGFGHMMDVHTQRVDVTGHVMSGLIKVEKLIASGKLSLELPHH